MVLKVAQVRAAVDDLKAAIAASGLSVSLLVFPTLGGDIDSILVLSKEPLFNGDYEALYSMFRPSISDLVTE